MPGTGGLVFLLLCLACAGPAAGQAPPLAEIDLYTLADEACTDPARAEMCRLLRAKIADDAAQSLLVVGASGQRAEAVDMVRQFTDWPEAMVRYAAATALGGLHPAEDDTPYLAALLNDAVPAVRVAALGSLDVSSDPMARRLVARARDRENQGTAMVPDPPPVDPAALPIALPEGTVPVYFTNDREDGIAAYVTDAKPQAVLDQLTAQVGGEALDLDALTVLYLPAGEGPAVDPDDPMAMVRFMTELNARIADLPDDQRQQAYLQALTELAASQQAVSGRTEHLDRWDNDDLYGAPRAVVLPGDPAAEADVPTRIALVYEDITLGRTGIAVQWVDPADMPPAPEPTEDTGEAGTIFGLQSTAADRTPDVAAVQERVWQGILAIQDPEAARDFAELFPDSVHAAEAAELQAVWAPLPPVEWEEGWDNDRTVIPPEPERQQSSLFERAATPALATDDDATFAANEAITVRYGGLPADSRRAWIAVAAAGSPDTAWGDWSYVDGPEGESSLPHQRPGDYELRLYLENPREVVGRLPVTVEAVEPATEPTLEADRETFAVGEPIGVRWSGLPGTRNDWITVVPAGTPDTTWAQWLYTDRNAAGRLVRSPATAPGDYEIRAYAENPREVIARIPITVTP